MLPLVAKRIKKLDELIPLDRVLLLRRSRLHAGARRAWRSPRSRRPTSRKALLDFVERFEAREGWTPQMLERGRARGARRSAGRRKHAFMLLRLAVTGRKASPPLFETMAVLGKEITRRRLRRRPSVVDARRSSGLARERSRSISGAPSIGTPAATARSTAASPAARPGRAGDTSLAVLAVMLTCCLVLTLQEYIGGSRHATRATSRTTAARYWELKGFAWWSGWRVLGYVIIPMIVIALHARRAAPRLPRLAARLLPAPVDLRRAVPR